MIGQKKVNELIKYWFESSKEKEKTMRSLYKSRRYADCLFFGHLVLEKILKAMIVENTKNYAPHIYNLPRLAQLADITLPQKEMKLLARVNEFNMQARYPDEKLEFYKICNKPYTDKYYQPILILYKNLCQKLKQKKW